MKKILLSAVVAFSLTAQAQVKEGRVVYDRVFQLPGRIFAADPSLATQLPKSQTSQYELLFGNRSSLWQFLPNAATEGDPNTFAAGGVLIRTAGSTTGVSFHNFETGMRTDQREVGERNFIVTDSINKLNWKLTEEAKTILNYTARKATAQRIETRTRMSMENGEMKTSTFQDTSAVVAWFTTDIPVPAGPDYQGQLPGLILELDISNGQTVYKAVEISPKVSLSKIKEPKEGKKVTAAEFVVERDKLMAEMRKNMRNGNVIRIQQ